MSKSQYLPLRGQKADFKPVSRFTRAKLNHLLTYATKLRQRGYSVKQINRISAKRAWFLLRYNITPREFDKRCRENKPSLYDQYKNSIRYLPLVLGSVLAILLFL